MASARSATLETVDQPDDLIQLAWDAGYDKKAVLCEGIYAASMLFAGEGNALATLFIPRPHPLEAVARWAEPSSHSRAINEQLRPFASAVLPACLVGYVVGRAMDVHNTIALVAIVLIAHVTIGSVFKVLIEATLRRRVAALDEESALAIVLAQVRLGMRMNAALIPHLVVRIRRSLTSQ